MKNGYVPLTSRLGILGSSYGIQLGKFEKCLAIVLVKGKEILAFNKFKNIKPTDGFNPNELVGWIITNICIPNINPYQIHKSVVVLLNQLKKGKK